MPNSFSENKNPANYQPVEEEDEIDLGELLSTLIDNKWLIILVTTIAVSLGIAKALIDTPIYKTDAMLQVEEHSQSMAGLEALEGLIEKKLPVLAEIELIKSRMILGETVKNLNLAIIAKPKYFPVIGKAIARRFQATDRENTLANPLFDQEQYAWGGEYIKVDSLNVPESLIGEKLILTAGNQGHYSLSNEDGETLLEGDVGKPAKNVLKDDRQIDIFVSQLKSRPNTQFSVVRQSDIDAITQIKESLGAVEKGKATGILELTLESPSPESAMQMVNEIANIYVKQNVEKKSAEAQKTLEFLEKQLPDLKKQLETATTILNDYRTQHGSIDLEIETQGVLAGVVELTTQITLLQEKRDELRQRFTESHPSVQAIDKQITRLQSQMASHDKKIQALPETQQVILRLSRDVQVDTELYTTLLNNAQTYRVAKAGTVGDVRIIDYAVLPTEPIKPKKPLIVAVAFILGLILGIAMAFIRKSLHRGIEDPDAIEKQLNIPVYATVPHSDNQAGISILLKRNPKAKGEQPLILATENKEDLAIESLRSLRTTLHFAFLEAQNNIIMITGPSPGIGKTFVSVNLAAVLADAGKKVLLIDGDMRKGFLHKSLKLSRNNGLSEIISNALPAEQAIKKISIANFDFIPTGALPPNPSELLLHDRFGEFLESISPLYDHVIIDSPPILAVTDAAIIGRMASATLMIVKAGEHPLRELQQSVKRLSQAGVNLKGIVFNNLPQTSSRYGYGYGYSKYVYQYNYK